MWQLIPACINVTEKIWNFALLDMMPPVNKNPAAT